MSYLNFDIDTLLRTMWSRSRVTQSGAELLWSGRELTTKVKNRPQLVLCASICCCVCGCIFQKD